ncbi:glycosyltransferase family 2 protein [Candidatus Daviesbacteria bacterium]|nr:glycosyltransferase family 2 protein [Candidatus Daviesbacteria bacterium]
MSPICSIIVLNYYGEKVIRDTLDSLLNLNYPKKNYEIIVVDNNSKDKSKEILNKYANNYKNIKLIFLNKNLGFSRGNNVGIKKAKGEFVALLNNDCVVEKNWLKELVKIASKDKKIFAVNSKILLYQKFINIKFNISPKLIPVYSWLSKSKLYNGSASKLYYLPLWRISNYFRIEVPFEPYKDDYIEFTILFNSRGIKFEDTTDLRNSIIFENNLLDITNIISHGDDIEFQIVINTSNKNILKKALNKVQNAGIMVFQDGYGRDIGAIVSGNKQFHEYDVAQYNKEKEVYAACGAAVLYSKKILDKIGYLDESFFMYYEDVEISERARFAGFKSVYTPKAVVRHHHALFSKEWSPFFIYHVEKGRLLHLYYNFPLRVFLLAYYNLVIDSIFTVFLILFKFKTFIYRLKSKKSESGEPNFLRRIQMIRALLYFVVYSPFLFIRKFKYNQARNKEVVTQNYLKILKGDWYLS